MSYVPAPGWKVFQASCIILRTNPGHCTCKPVGGASHSSEVQSVKITTRQLRASGFTVTDPSSIRHDVNSWCIVAAEVSPPILQAVNMSNAQLAKYKQYVQQYVFAGWGPPDDLKEWGRLFERAIRNANFAEDEHKCDVTVHEASQAGLQGTLICIRDLHAC